MPGAEQIGEAFVELGAKKGQLKKDLDDAKRMVNNAFAQMGKMSDRMGSSLLKFGKAAGAAAGVGGGFATTVKGLQAGADAQQVVMDQIAKFGEKFGGPKAVRQLKELRIVIEEVNKASEHSIPILTLQRTAFFLLQNSIKPTVPLMKSLIGHTSQLKIGLEEAARRYAAVWFGEAPALKTFLVPSAPQAGGVVQARDVEVAGLKRFEAYVAKLDSLPGLLKKIGAVKSNLWGRFGLGLGILTGKSPDEKGLLDIAEAASGAERFQGKSDAARAKRGWYKPGTGQILSDEEIEEEELSAAEQRRRDFLRRGRRHLRGGAPSEFEESKKPYKMTPGWSFINRVPVISSRRRPSTGGVPDVDTLISAIDARRDSHIKIPMQLSPGPRGFFGMGPPAPEGFGMGAGEAVDELKNIVDRLDQIMELRKEEGTLVTHRMMQDVRLGE